MPLDASRESSNEVFVETRFAKMCVSVASLAMPTGDILDDVVSLIMSPHGDMIAFLVDDWPAIRDAVEKVIRDQVA